MKEDNGTWYKKAVGYPLGYAMIAFIIIMQIILKPFMLIGKWVSEE